MRTTNATQGKSLRRPLAVVVIAAGLTLAGCANTPTNAPGASSTAPSAPVQSSTPAAQPPAAQPQAATVNWTRSVCQALGPALGQLGSPPQPDLNNPTATRQAYISYFTNARNVTQQAIDRLPSIGPPPVQNGQQILGQVTNQLTQLRDNLNEALTQLNQANPNDTGAMAQAFTAASHVVGLRNTLTADPQLRAALDQTQECQSLPG